MTTAGVREVAPPAAPQAISEQHLGPSAATQRRELWRFWSLVLLFGLLTASVVFALVLHQALRLGGVRATAQPHQADSARGTIVDRNGAVLVADQYFYEVSVDPGQLNQDEDRQTVAAALEQLAGLPASQTIDLLRSYAERRYLRLARAIPLEQGERILAEQQRLTEEQGVHPLTAVTLTLAPQRYYPEQSLAAHLLGIVAMLDGATWLRGVYGVEGYYDSFLRERDGVRLTRQTTQPFTQLPTQVRRFLPSLAGRDLVLTIDRGVQWIVEEELQQALEIYGAQTGSILVMEPQSGAVLAMASAPTYDPGAFAEADPALLINPAISAQYEPGSVFKIITAAAALDSGVVTATQILTDSGSIAVGQRVILNSDRAGYGPVTMAEALARSLNVITAQWALLLGEQQFYQYIERFGFGKVTEVDLAGEIYGLVKQPGMLNWSLSDLGTNSFGQGLAVTPIQMANATAAIANGGRLMRPYVVAERALDGQVQVTEPTVLGTAVSAETARQMTDILVEVVEQGNQAARVPGYRVAGKSGTAQIPTQEGYTEDETIVTFVGYAPADAPRFVVLVKLERPDPAISRWAGRTAAPTFSRVASRLLRYYGVPPDATRLGQQPTGQ